ncbi:MAG: hypothetical protein KAT71_06125 [Gammaproteobacteria bacterium]|nr:hypothetical protein [Gammaproteobacteria bacterium]
MDNSSRIKQQQESIKRQLTNIIRFRKSLTNPNMPQTNESKAAINRMNAAIKNLVTQFRTNNQRLPENNKVSLVNRRPAAASPAKTEPNNTAPAPRSNLSSAQLLKLAPTVPKHQPGSNNNNHPSSNINRSQSHTTRQHRTPTNPPTNQLSRSAATTPTTRRLGWIQKRLDKANTAAAKTEQKFNNVLAKTEATMDKVDNLNRGFKTSSDKGLSKDADKLVKQALLDSMPDVPKNNPGSSSSGFNR